MTAVVVATLTLTAVGAIATGPSGALDVDDRVVATELVTDPDGTSVRGEAVTVTVRAVAMEPGPSVEVTGTVQVLDVYRGVRTTVATVPVVAGEAQVVTTDLPPGRHVLTARFLPGPGLVPGRSIGAVHRVRPDCPAPGEGGPGAVVHLVYTNLLHRCPDRAGFDHWVGRLAAGMSPEAFARTIAATSEAVGWVVEDAYRTMLGRSADASGQAFWVRHLQGHGRYDRLLADLGGSAEFWALAGASDEGFVARLYERILDRPPDRPGYTYWLGQASVRSHRGLVLVLANQDEPLARLVTLAYQEILERPPTEAELVRAVARLRATGDRSGLDAQLIGHPDFAALA